MMDTHAVIPTFSFPTIKQEQEKVQDELRERQEAWALLADHPSYGLLKDYILKLVRGLGAELDAAITRGADDRELAIKLQVIKLTESNLLSIINNIEQNARGVDTRGDRTVR